MQRITGALTGYKFVNVRSLLLHHMTARWPYLDTGQKKSHNKLPNLAQLAQIIKLDTPFDFP